MGKFVSRRLANQFMYAMIFMPMEVKNQIGFFFFTIFARVGTTSVDHNLNSIVYQHRI